jgi:four helix bundle protein
VRTARTARDSFTAMASGVKELKLWQESVALGGDVIRLVRQTARRETKSFSDRIMHAAAAVATGVADGYARYEPLEQRRCYLGARRALAELETHLAIARHAELIPPAAVAQLSGRASTVARLLGGYLSYIDRQLGSPTATEGTAPAATAPRPPLHPPPPQP